MLNKKKNEDRLSLLPDSLLHHILSSLNTKEVVQTCVLSNRWKTVWTRIPILNFDFNSYPYKGSARNSVMKVFSFDKLITRVLSKHRGSQITKLSYSAPNSVTHSKKKLVKFWICFAAFHMVEELCINSAACVVDFEYWARSLSACQSLNVLKFSVFSGCVEIDDCEEGGVLMLPLLRNLEIGNLCLDRLQKNMFSGCPNLESLVLIDFCFNCRRNASICALKLEHIELRSSSYNASDWLFDPIEIELLTPNLRSVKFVNALPTMKSTLDFPCLDKLNITGNFGNDYEREHDQDQVVELLRLFHNARSITMPLITIHALLSRPASVNASFSFHNLQHLKLEASKTCKKIDLPMDELQYLLKCPSLKTMAIDLN